MVTFFVALALLIVGYVVYSRVSEKVFSIDTRLTPAMANPDGVDITPLPKWKAFLIELLNIAGTGPIFGAISGALFGPIVFLWIVLGCILGGAVHDYFSGMISSRNNGESIVKLSGKYTNKVVEVIMRIFSVVLLILVTAVFVVSPSELLQSLTGGNVKAWIWMIIILVYYFISTILPIDKIIGKSYPIFGIILIVMAISVIVGVMVNSNYPMIEIIGNLRDFSKNNGDLPWWPFMLTTVACGAVSGFHATQSPMIAKCIKSEKEGRQVFYGAMVAEGVIALIWAAAAMAFFKVNTSDGWNLLSSLGGGTSTTVEEIAKGVLGPVGTVLAIVGVVICPITSGDTALRSCRLIVGETFKLDQKKIKNRLILTAPLFAIVIGLCVWDFAAREHFNILWRWFAWSNQVLAAITLWAATGYLFKTKENKLMSLFTAIPAIFMTAVVFTYIFAEPNLALGRFGTYQIAIIHGIVTTLILSGFYFFKLIVAIVKKNKTSSKK